MSKRENYPLFVHWAKSLDWILDRCEKMPKYVRFTLSTRIANISLDVLEKIVEAIYRKDRNEMLRYINLQLELLRVLFRICHSRHYISGRQYAYISGAVNEAGKMCGGWLKVQA